MKGAIQPDHAAVNNFELLVVGLGLLTPIDISGIEDELQTVDLPDRTTASGGNRGPVEFTMSLAAHHTAEQVIMELWFQEAQDPVTPTYKKVGTLLLKTIGSNIARSYSLIGLYTSKRGTPDLERENEGDLAVIEWTMKADDMLPI